MSFQHLITIFIISLILNTILFGFIYLGYFGKNLRNKFHDLITQRKNLMTIIIFIFSFIVIYYLNNPILLDDNITIITKIEGNEIQLSGETINALFYQLGSAGVFAAGARIAASLVVKQPLSILPKAGIIAAGASGLTVTYRLLFNNHLPSNNGLSSIKTGPMEIKIEGITLEQVKSSQSASNFLKEHFGTSNLKLDHFHMKSLNFGNTPNLNPGGTSRIIQELDKFNPDWRDTFINSPLESDKVLYQFALDTLNNNLILHFISTYLLLMLLIIFLAKIILINSDFKFLDRFFINNTLKLLIIKYISIWQKSNNIWIFFIIICVIIFNIASLISIFNLISVLK